MWTVYARIVLDQEFIPTKVYAWQIYTDYRGQSFTVGKPGRLLRIELTLSKDTALRTDVEAVFIHSPSDRRFEFTIPFWKLSRSPGTNLFGVDLESLDLTVKAGDFCAIVFHSSLPWGTRPAAILLGGCSGPELIRCGDEGSIGYVGGSVLSGGSLSSLSDELADFGIRTFVAQAETTSDAPKLFERPMDREVWIGDTLFLDTFAAGSEPLTYQWFFEGTPIQGATNRTLVYTARSEHAGSYHVQISNSAGSILTPTAMVEVLNAPKLHWWTQSAKAMVGSPIELTVTAEGVGALRYQWLFNGEIIPNATSSRFAIPSAALSHSGRYTVQVTDSLGTAASPDIPVVVRDDRDRIKWISTLSNVSATPAIGPDGTIYAVNYDRGLNALTPEGQLKWQWSGDAHWVAPVVVDGQGILSGMRWMTLHTFDGQPRALLELLEIAGSPVVQANGVMYLVEGTNNVKAVNFLTGAVLWQRALPVRNRPFDPVLNEVLGLLYVGFDWNGVAALSLDTGEQRWEFRTERYISDPAIGVDGTLFVGAATNIFALDGRTGGIKWRFSSTNTVASGMAVDQNNTLFCKAWSVARALDGYTGALKWETPVDEPGWTAPVLLSDGTLLIAGAQLVTALDQQTGAFKWDFLSRYISGPITVGTDGSILVVTADRELYAWKGTAPIADGPWTRSRGNVRNTGIANLAKPSTGVPVIEKQPENNSVNEGERIDLAVTVTSSPALTYQWFKDGSALDGQISAILVILSAKASDAGLYTVRITNAAGSITSAPAMVMVSSSELPEGHVIAWGSNTYGQTNCPPDLEDAIAIAAGNTHTMALRANGTVMAWGGNNAGQIDVPTGLTGVVAIAAGDLHSVALKQDGTVVAWGATPAVPFGLRDIKNIAAGDGHTLALKQDGTVDAWGRADWGATTVPAGLHGVVALAGGGAHTLALRNDGTVASWGLNDRGQSTVPAGATGIIAVAGGGRFSVALKSNGTVLGWGSNDAGELNITPGLNDVKAIAADWLHSLAIKLDGTVVAWGANPHGQTNVPSGLSNVIAVAAGTSHSVALVRGSKPATQTNNVLVTTLAGTGTAGLVNAADGLQAQFNQPNSPAVSKEGVIFVPDGANHVIRFITRGGAVGTWAGRAQAGFADGPASSALFDSPLAVCLDRDGDLLVADTLNDRVRKIISVGLRSVITVAGDGVRGYRDGPAGEAQFNFPNDLVQGSSGNIYVIEFNNHTIRRINLAGEVSTFAGNGQPGSADGKGTAAQFNKPAGIAIDAQGNLFVTEWASHRVRKIQPDGTVTTIAGTGALGFTDGTRSEATLNTPDAIVADQSGALFITEQGNHAIRRIDSSGAVTTIAGKGTAGFADGDKTQALFNRPGGIALHPDGSLIVADTMNHRIRRVTLGTETNLPPGDGFVVLELNPTLQIYGVIGQVYQIQYAEAAAPANWIPLTNVTISTVPERWTDPRPVVFPKRFYRAVMQ